MHVLLLEMDSVLTQSVLIENSLRELIGLRITMTVAKNSKRTVYREGLVYAYETGMWSVHDDTTNETFVVTFDDFISNKIFVHLD